MSTILVKQKDTGRYSRKYVGIADDLNKRYSEHLSPSEKNKHIYNGVRDWVCGFDYAFVETVKERKDTELGLYKKHKYNWNDIEPEGSGEYSSIEVIEHSP